MTSKTGPIRWLLRVLMAVVCIVAIVIAWTHVFTALSSRGHQPSLADIKDEFASIDAFPEARRKGEGYAHWKQGSVLVTQGYQTEASAQLVLQHYSHELQAHNWSFKREYGDASGDRGYSFCKPSLSASVWFSRCEQGRITCFSVGVSWDESCGGPG